jgi:4-nitrophenyl phosphatase
MAFWWLHGKEINLEILKNREYLNCQVLTMKKFDGVILDLNGTLLMGTHPLDGSISLINYLNSNNIPYIVFTNDSTTTSENWAKLLSNVNIQVPSQSIVTSATVLIDYFENHISKKSEIYLIGEDGLSTALTAKGYQISDNPYNEVVVVMGIDTKFTPQKITRACQLVSNGAQFYVTNPDRLEFIRGKISPGAGAWAKVIESTTSISPIVLGKPSKFAFEVAINKLNVSGNSIIMVGDNIETDIIGAKSFGLKTALIRTGLANETSTLNTQADYSFENLNLFRDFLEKT